jgi:hypothetical protein
MHRSSFFAFALAAIAAGILVSPVTGCGPGTPRPSSAGGAGGSGDASSSASSGGSGTGGAAVVCGSYCGTLVPEAEVSKRCALAFGASFIVVQQCDQPAPPAGCKAMDDFSPEFSAPCADGTDYPVFCCE